MLGFKSDLLKLIEDDPDIRKAVIDLVVNAWQSNAWDFYWNMNDYNKQGLSKYPRSASGQLQLPKSVEELEKKWGGVTPESIKEKAKINIEDLIPKKGKTLEDAFDNKTKEELFKNGFAEVKEEAPVKLQAKKPTLQEALKHILKDAVESNSYGVRDLMEGN